MILMFLVFTLFFMAIVEVFTVLFRLTGFNEKKARFQAISLLSCVGYTTKESESIVSHPMRRAIAEVGMILGYCGSATLISFVISFFKYKMTVYDFYYVIVYAVFVVIISRVKIVKVTFDRLIKKFAEKILSKNGLNMYTTLNIYGQTILVEITITLYLPILNIDLEELDIKNKNNILTLMIKRKNGIITSPSRNDKLMLKDKVTVYGEMDNIRKIFKLV